MRCPYCHGDGTSFGPRTIRVVALVEGAVVHEKLSINRFRCRTCHRMYRNGPPAIADGVETAVAHHALRWGARSAARWSGLDAQTVKRCLDQWLAEKEADFAVVPCNAIAIVRAETVARSILVLIDPVEDRVIDVVEDSSLEEWLRWHAGSIDAVLIEIDVQMEAAVRRALPTALVGMTPCRSRSALETATRKSIRAIARARTGNFAERDDLIAVRDEALSDEERAELRCWSAETRLLRRCYQHLMDGLQDLSMFGRTLRSVLDILSERVSGSHLFHLLRRWGDAMRDGIAMDADRAVMACDALALDLSRMSPWPAYPVVRAWLLHVVQPTTQPASPALSAFCSGMIDTAVVRTVDAIRRDLSTWWASTAIH